MTVAWFILITICGAPVGVDQDMICGASVVEDRSYTTLGECESTILDKVGYTYELKPGGDQAFVSCIQKEVSSD